MPQTFQVLRCYKCAVFQVHPTKKSNKVKCKMCGEKQSIKRFYGIGSGKECRMHVQRLNGIRGDLENAKCEDYDSEDSMDQSNTSENIIEREPVNHVPVKKSKWQDYVDTENEDNKLLDPSPDETEMVLEIQKKRTKKYINDISQTSALPQKGYILKSEHTSDCVVQSFQKNEPVVTKQNNATLKDDAKKSISTQRVHNSKWSQFVEDGEKDSGDSNPTGYHNSQDEPKLIFSSLDDDDLDAVLQL